jgi:competence protein ComEC
MQPAEVIGQAGPAAPEEGGARRPLAWLAENFIAERERWALWVPVLVGSGIGLYFWLRVEPPLLLGPLALALALAAVAAALRLGRGAVPAVAAAAVALGFAAAQFQAWWVSAPILAQRIGPAIVEARIVAVDPLPEGTRLVLEPRSIAGLAPAALPARIRECRASVGGAPSSTIATMIRNHTSAPALSPLWRIASTISRALAVAFSP